MNYSTTLWCKVILQRFLVSNPVYICNSSFTKVKYKNSIPHLNGQFLPPAYVVWREGNSFTLFVCPHLGGGWGSGPAGRGGQVSELTGGGVRSSQPGGGGGSGQWANWGGGQVQPAGGGVSQRGHGVSILCPLAGGMPLAFTQEVFLVLKIFFIKEIVAISITNNLKHNVWCIYVFSHLEIVELLQSFCGP